MDDPGLRHHFAFPAKQPWALGLFSSAFTADRAQEPCSLWGLQLSGPKTHGGSHIVGVCAHPSELSTYPSELSHHALPTILSTRAVQGCWLGGAVNPFQAHPLVLSPPICVFPPGMLQLDQTSEPPDGWLKDRFWPHPPNF